MSQHERLNLQENNSESRLDARTYSPKKKSHLKKAGLVASGVLAAGAAIGFAGSAKASEGNSSFLETHPVVNAWNFDSTKCPDLNILDNGRIIDNQYLSIGQHMGATGNAAPDEIVAFNTNRTGTGYPDFEVKRGMFSVIPDNLDDLNQDGLIDGPSISPLGGTQYFTYDNPTTINSIDVVDKDGSDLALIRVFADNGSVLKSVVIPTEADGAVETVAVNQSNVRRLEVSYSEDMAIGNINCD